MQLPTVFVMTEPRRARSGGMPNLSEIESYGAVQFCYPAGMIPEFSANRVADTTRKNLEGFDPARDYVTTVGGSLFGAVILGGVLGNMGVTKFTFLRWDRATNPDGSRSDTHGKYIPVAVDLSDEYAAA